MKNNFKIKVEKENIKIFYKDILIFNNHFKKINFDFPILPYFQKKYDVLGVDITEERKAIFEEISNDKMSNIILSNLLYKKVYKINL